MLEDEALNELLSIDFSSRYEIGEWMSKYARSLISEVGMLRACLESADRAFQEE